MSPVTMVCTRSADMVPDVGFWFPAVMSSSSRFTVHTARIGIPLVVKRVYFACTWVTNAGKLVTPPHLNLTRNGIGFLPLTASLQGTQQRKRSSTEFTTLTLSSIVESKNSSNVSLHGSAPLYSGGPDFLPLAGFRSHLADLLIVTSLGLNWKLIVP